MEDTDQKQTGTVKWFNTAKGYGFIAPDEGGSDLFAHVNQLAVDPNQLREGTKVEYRVTEGRKGPQAVDVALLAEGAEADAGENGGEDEVVFEAE